MKRLSIYAFAALFLAVSLQAAEHRSVIILVDPSGLALIPDGTELPRGVTVYGRDHKPLVFAHAPEAAFTAARNTIAASEARPGSLRVSAIPKFHLAANDSDTTYYVYFLDGSYVAARRLVIDYGPPSGTLYAVETSAYTPAGDYYSGTLSASQSDPDHSGYNASAACTIDSNGGTCATGLYGYETSYSFSAHVTCNGYIHHHYLPICGRYGEPPCNENYSGSIDIYFP